MRNLFTMAAVILAAASDAAAAQSVQRWSMACRDTQAGRQCDLTVALPFRVRKSADNPVVASWSVVNRAMGIDETLEVRIDDQLLPSHRLVGVTEPDRHTMTPPRPAGGQIPGAPLRDALVAGRDLSVVLIDDATGRQAAAKLPAAGFEAARAALMGEIAKGANRK